jgi:Flp pilus assembly protein TadD
LAALGTRAEAMRLVASKVDRSQVDAATTAYREYIAATVDPAKKSKLQMDVAKMMFDAEAYDKAVGEYRRILAADQNNTTAHLHLGLSLFGTGDRAKFQEAANLGAFIETATETDPLRADAMEILEFLKVRENVTPKGIRREGSVPR